MNPSAKHSLYKILSDNQSGSTELLLKLIRWCKDKDKKFLGEMISVASNELQTFSAVQSFIKDLKKLLKASGKHQVEKFLIEQSERIENRYLNLFKNAFPHLKTFKKIVTLSNSRTIIEILKRLNKQKKIFITICESRPQLEGRIMVKELLKHKIRTEIIPDVLLSAAIEKSDCAIIGADTVLSNGDVVNKTGSRSLAIACRHFKKPFYVLATSDKFSNKKKYIPEERNKNEIWSYNHKLLKRTNYYFEVIEKKLITKIIRD